MGYARHIGRVGALAVTLGVGAAIANAPGIAYADTTGTSQNGDSSQKTTSSTPDTSSTTGQPTSPTDGAAADAGDLGSTTPDPKSQRRSVLRSVVVGAIRDIADIADGAVAAGNAAGATSRLGKQDSTGGDTANRQTSNISTTATRTRTRTITFDDAAENLQSTVNAVTQRVETTFQQLSTPGPNNTASTSLNTAPQIFATAATPLLQPDPRPRTSLVPIFTDPLGALLKPLVYGGTNPPLQAPTLMAILLAVRDEVERILLPRPTQVAYPPTTSQPVNNPDLPSNTDQHVLVIAIDGTNMSKVIEGDNENFDELMSESTVSAPSIVGHTTVSNPSWTAVLTGAWNEKTGVINNVYTPTTYDRWPTVFTQLENHNPDIRTKAIADWDVIGAIAASGTGADEVVYIAQVEDDPNWAKTDRAVTDETVATLEDAEAPNFMVTYLVQVDENGHMYGGDSPEYEAAIERTDENLGMILDAVAEREEPCTGGNTTACGEDWTIIVVTDHGHQPQPGFGHGFQSPRETETFVIANGPQFDTENCGATCARFNPDYEIVDVTPTVLSLFGAPQDPRSDGVPLQSLNGSSSILLNQAQLEDALEAQIASNDFPNIIVNVALSVRTIVAFVPYFVHGAGLPAPLGDILYVATNVPAQVVAFGTGVYGVRLFPILPPPPAITFIPDAVTSIDAFLRMDCGSDGLAPAGCVAV